MLIECVIGNQRPPVAVVEDQPEGRGAALLHLLRVRDELVPGRRSHLWIEPGLLDEIRVARLHDDVEQQRPDVELAVPGPLRPRRRHEVVRACPPAGTRPTARSCPYSTSGIISRNGVTPAYMSQVLVSSFASAMKRSKPKFSVGAISTATPCSSPIVLIMGWMPGHPVVEGAVRLALLSRQRGTHRLLRQRRRDRRAYAERRGAAQHGAAIDAPGQGVREQRASGEFFGHESLLFRWPRATDRTFAARGGVAPRQQASPRPLDFVPQSRGIVGTADPECQRRVKHWSPQRHAKCDTKRRGSGVWTPLALALHGEQAEVERMSMNAFRRSFGRSIRLGSVAALAALTLLTPGWPRRMTKPRSTPLTSIAAPAPSWATWSLR